MEKTTEYRCDKVAMRRLTKPFARVFAIAFLVGVQPVAEASWLYCKAKPADCIPIQGRLIPFDAAEEIIERCRDFTRNNIGATALRMSFVEVMDRTGGAFGHPLLRAWIAYSSLHDSPLRFDRSLPIEQRYYPLRKACGEAFRDMGAE